MPDSLPKDPESLALLLLGPRSAEAFRDPALRRDYVLGVDRGADREDALLAAIHPAASRDSELAGEFLAYFAQLLFGRRDGVEDPRLRQVYAPEDLVQSVVGDLLPRLGEFEFNTRAEFLSLLTLRLGWKKQDKLRRPRPGRLESIDMSPDELLGDGRVRGPGGTPLSKVVSAEQEELLILAINRLSEENQTLMRMLLRGLSREEMARIVGCSTPAVRKRLERARAALGEALAALTGEPVE